MASQRSRGKASLSDSQNQQWEVDVQRDDDTLDQNEKVSAAIQQDVRCRKAHSHSIIHDSPAVRTRTQHLSLMVVPSGFMFSFTSFLDMINMIKQRYLQRRTDGCPLMASDPDLFMHSFLNSSFTSAHMCFTARREDPSLDISKASATVPTFPINHSHSDRPTTAIQTNHHQQRNPARRKTQEQEGK